MLDLAFSPYAFDLIYVILAPASYKKCGLTSNSHHSLRLLSSHKKHNVPLARIDIVVLEEEGLVDAILLERRELDQQVQWAGKCFLENQVLLSPDL